ncbi:hypothetical protein L1987_80486 [Smallanthus sonchifolius]|uniref:Uncharacterized protein n=1 Tax=Smallanthus sonchifolius TaxID=185202 RepID=A0ACB8YNC9_9ASTR|nr:hypothetical protein L1987_80486 [Smallanthus sonchifolius]
MYAQSFSNYYAYDSDFSCIVLRDSRYKVIFILIDSPEGDALASDLMLREIVLLAKSKRVIASLVDVALLEDTIWPWQHYSLREFLLDRFSWCRLR